MLAGRAVSGWCLGVTRSAYLLYYQQVPQYDDLTTPGTRCVTPTPPCSGCRPPSPPRMWPRSPSSGPRGGYPRCAGYTPRHQHPSPGDRLLSSVSIQFISLLYSAQVLPASGRPRWEDVSGGREADTAHHGGQRPVPQVTLHITNFA